MQNFDTPAMAIGRQTHPYHNHAPHEVPLEAPSKCGAGSSKRGKPCLNADEVMYHRCCVGLL